MKKSPSGKTGAVQIDYNTERPHEPPEVSDPGGIRSREALRQGAMGAAA